jgi:hypothetical protein
MNLWFSVYGLVFRFSVKVQGFGFRDLCVAVLEFGVIFVGLGVQGLGFRF